MPISLCLWAVCRQSRRVTKHPQPRQQAAHPRACAPPPLSANHPPCPFTCTSQRARKIQLHPAARARPICGVPLSAAAACCLRTPSGPCPAAGRPAACGPQLLQALWRARSCRCRLLLQQRVCCSVRVCCLRVMPPRLFCKAYRIDCGRQRGLLCRGLAARRAHLAPRAAARQQRACGRTFHVRVHSFGCARASTTAVQGQLAGVAPQRCKYCCVRSAAQVQWSGPHAKVVLALSKRQQAAA